MENKINIAELLKDCPKGMELDCTMFDNVTFIGVDNNKIQFPIEIAIGGLHSKYLTKEGCYHDNTLISEAKCVIFPKGKTTWEGFQRPIKDGDVIVDTLGGIHIMQNSTMSYCYFDRLGILDKTKTTCVRVERLATEKEKEKLFQAIKDNGYKWNPETKALEELVEPRFKVGDKIKNKCPNFRGERIIANCNDAGYFTTINDWIDIEDQDNWELVSNKFDITTLKAFDSRVLVRMDNYDLWKPAVFGFVDKSSGVFYVSGGNSYIQCIPYDRNEHLRGTTNDCDDFYKTWE